MNRRDQSLLDYDALKKLAATHVRPVSTMIALSGENDPFSITPARHAGAKWCASLPCGED